LGGLSGIDYNAKQQRYVLISDDRSQADTPDPLRLYFAKLDFDGESFHGVRFTGMLPLREADGAPYPKLPAPKAPDPEGVRIDPVTGHFVWVSEGDRASRLEPWVRESDADGRTVRDYLLPAMFQQQAQRGPRANAAFEGGYVFYNAFLPEIADKTESGKLSGAGWALGFLAELESTNDDPASHYSREVGGEGLLSREDEADLGRAMEEGWDAAVQRVRSRTQASQSRRSVGLSNRSQSMQRYEFCQRSSTLAVSAIGLLLPDHGVVLDAPDQFLAIE
jgi:hypothetical protein